MAHINSLFDPTFMLDYWWLGRVQKNLTFQPNQFSLR
jgi:hypothetical protein